MNSTELENRLIDYSVSIIRLTNNTAKNRVGLHLTMQLIRSATSSALNYGEAQGGESRKDFLHKMKIVLKELRESYICLRIIKKAELCKAASGIDSSIDETNELISIFVKSINTTQRTSR